MTLQNEVDSFDLSPSGQRAVISARGQILTIATTRGDITRIAPDPMASRSQSPKWSPDGKFIAYVSDKSGRDEIWMTDPDGKTPKQITNLDNEKGAMQWTPDSKALLYTAADKKLYSYSVADGEDRRSSRRTPSRASATSRSRPTASGSRSRSRTGRCARTSTSRRSRGGEERHVSEDRVHYSEANPAWTADGRYLVFTSSEGFSNGIASQGGITTTTRIVGDAAAGSGSRSAESRHRQRSAGARRAGGGGRAGGAGGAPAPVTVQIDWNNIARRARQIPVPGDPITGLRRVAGRARPIAFNLVDARAAGGGAARASPASTS